LLGVHAMFQKRSVLGRQESGGSGVGLSQNLAPKPVPLSESHILVWD
jgi:hypothetical protein